MEIKIVIEEENFEIMWEFKELFQSKNLEKFQMKLYFYFILTSYWGLDILSQG